MGSYCIIGKKITFLAKSEIALVDYKEYFDTPSFSLYTDGFILIYCDIGRNDTKVFFAIVLISDIDHFSRGDFPSFITSTLTGRKNHNFLRSFLYCIHVVQTGT